MASAKYSLDKSDLKKVGQAMVYSGLSSALAALTVVLSQPDALNWRTAIAAVLVPAVNGALVVLKNFLDGEDLSSNKALKD